MKTILFKNIVFLFTLIILLSSTNHGLAQSLSLSEDGTIPIGINEKKLKEQQSSNFFKNIVELFQNKNKKNEAANSSVIPPSNDNCSGALWLTPGNNCISNYNAWGATQSLPASTCSGITSNIVQDVWFAFVATDVNQYIQVDPSSGYDPVIEVRSGPNCNGTFIGCLDQGGGDGYLEWAWLNNAIIGQTYFVRVYHYEPYGIPPATTTFEICVNLSPGVEDIYITNESVSVSTAACGDQITVSCTHNYSGNVLDSNLPSFDVDYYLSTNPTLEVNIDQLLGGDSSSLGSDDTNHNETESVTIPANTSPGNYYILFFGDADDELAESNENNNVESVPIQITCSTGPEDIFVTNASLSASSVACGGTVVVSCTQNYSGNQLDANLPSIDIDYYLSTNSTYEPNVDLFLNDDISSLGSDDPYHNESETLVIPLNTPPGTYYIIIVGDADNEITEVDEMNNIVPLQIQVTCGPSQYQVSTNSVPSNGGTTNGFGSYAPGATATVTASENTGWFFINWAENGQAVSTNASYQFTVNANRTLTANFGQNIVNITTASSPSNGGTTSGFGNFPVGTSTTVIASENPGWNFINWTENGQVVATSPSYQFIVNSNRTLIANFSQDAYNITTSASPSNGGTTNGFGSYNSGTTATVTATENSSWTFLNWTENGMVVATSASYQFVVNSNRTLVANFSQDAYNITATANPTNGGTITGTGAYLSGLTAGLQATPTAGWQFVNWTENGTIVWTDPNYSFPVTEDRNLVAQFTTTTSLDDPSLEKGIQAYPNPTSGWLTIEIDTDLSISEAELQVYDLLGRQLLTKQLSSHLSSIDLRQFTKGAYILHIKSMGQNEPVAISKVIQVH